MSEEPSGSPFPPPELDPVLTQADESQPAPAPARGGFSRRAVVGVLLVVTAVLAASLATTALLLSGGGGTDTAEIAPGLVAGVSVTAKPPPAGEVGSPVLVVDIGVASGGKTVLALLGGAAFRNGDSTTSVRLHPGSNRVRLALSRGTPPGRYRVRILLEDTAGHPVAIERPFRVAGA